jgi:ATP synthase protein I
MEVPVADNRTAISSSRFLRTTLSQLVLAVIATAAVFFTVGGHGAVSFACGAACSGVPQLFFALRLDRAARQSAAQAARLGLAAGAGKFVLGAVGFALVFALVRPIEPLLVFAGFALMWAAQIWEAARLLRQPQR